MDFNAILNGGMGLGGGIGAMPVAAPYTTAGVLPGAALQFGGQGAVPYMAGLLGGAGAAGGAMAMQQQPTQQPAEPAKEGMSNGDMMKLASMAMQGFSKGQQGVQAPTQQIIRDSNQFRFAGNPQQQMAQVLRQRG